jgi:hypothetical protein
MAGVLGVPAGQVVNRGALGWLGQTCAASG